MIIDKQKSFTIVSSEKDHFNAFLDHFKESYTDVKKHNVIIDLSSFGKVAPTEIIAFQKKSKKHIKKGKSFVIVAVDVSYNDIPEELNVVPTIQEAKDIIEMEEIERDLGF